MRKYYLLTDTCRSNPNPGDILIGKGIEYLIGEYEASRDQQCVVGYISLFSNEKQVDIQALRDADCIVVCGTPQFGSQGASPIFDNFLPLLKKASSKGIKLCNLYMGITNDYIYDDANQEGKATVVADHEPQLRDIYSLFDILVSRSPTAKTILELIGLDAPQMLCSTFYAPLLYGVCSEPKEYNVITVGASDNEILIDDDFWHDVSELFGNDHESIFICHSIGDYARIRGYVDKLYCVNTPLSLLRLYSKAARVVSLRVHGSTSALAVGASVMNVEKDSRSDIVRYAGIPSVRFVDFIKNTQLEFSDVNATGLMDADKSRLFSMLDDMWGDS